MSALKVEYLPLSDLLPYARNARTHSDAQVAQIAASIKEFGFTNPILISPDRDIIAGHGRALAAAKLGLEAVPCIRLGHLTETQRKAYVIADNRLALNAGWDSAMLSLELLDLKADDFDLDLLGFDGKELKALLNPEVDAADGNTDPDDVPNAVEPRTKVGDLWILGEHRLVCGDATVVDTVARLFAGRSPLLMVTDPPYGVEYDATWRNDALPHMMGTARKDKVANDNRADWYDVWAISEAQVAYVWHASAFTDVVLDSLRRANFEVRQQIIWNKSVAAMGRSAYHWKHEPCWYAVRKGKDANWQGDRKQVTVWDAASPIHIMSGSKEDKTIHPTQKPISLYTKAIENHTRPGDVVYDPFGGSGTLIMAAERLSRVGLSVELEPKFCDVILARWEAFTGKQAQLEAPA